jgi:uncharacterized membrane protein
MKIEIKEKPWDLAIIIAIAVLLLVLVGLTPESPLRVILGLLFILFLPGYAIVSALYPQHKAMGGFERIALSIGLSIAVSPLIALVLSYTPWGIGLYPLLIFVFILIVFVVGVAWYRRLQLPVDERFYISFELIREKNTTANKVLTLILLIAIISVSMILCYMIIAPTAEEKFTKFYILGPDGMAENYPENLIAGENATVIIGIVCYEYARTDYKVTIRLVPINGTAPNITYYTNTWNDTFTLTPDKALSRNITLVYGEKLEQPFTFNVATNGAYKLEFLLFKKGNDINPYRALHLWIEVKS